MNVNLLRTSLTRNLIITLLLVGVAAANQAGVSAALRSTKDRAPVAEFALTNSAGVTVKLSDYRGKVVLLDFWATWCTGCKQEIPWFAEFQKTYGGEGFAVVGVSMDEGGWKVVKPFLAETNVPYQILLGDSATFQRFGFRNLPDTLLIDRQGRLSAAYTTGLVNKGNVETNIQALLSER